MVELDDIVMTKKVKRAEVREQLMNIPELVFVYDFSYDVVNCSLTHQFVNYIHVYVCLSIIIRKQQSLFKTFCVTVFPANPYR